MPLNQRVFPRGDMNVTNKESAMHREYIYSLYERLWHWFQAIAILTLILTGLAIHYPDRLGLVPFAVAVRLHNFVGGILVVNAFLGFFYYLTTGTIRQFIPEPREFHVLAWQQLRYYLFGIFRGEPHPLQRSARRRLNPLQQIVYLAILNILLPLQVITGLTLWIAQYSPTVLALFGGISGLAAIHMLGAWLFMAFVLAHVYLATTGPKIWSHFVTMITGYEIIQDSGVSPPEVTSQQLGTSELDVRS